MAFSMDTAQAEQVIPFTDNNIALLQDFTGPDTTFGYLSVDVNKSL